MRRTIELLAFLAALLLAAMALHAWLAAHDEQQRLAATLATQKQLLDAADARERTRDAALNDTLATIAKLKATALTPTQIVQALPNYLPLPQPITLENSPAAQKSASQSRQQVRGAQSAISFAPSVATSSAPPPQAANAPNSSAAPPQRASEIETSPASQTSASQSTENGSARAAQKGIAPSGSSSGGTAVAAPPTAPPGTASSSSSPASSTSFPSSDLPPAPTAQIPAADLQPLFDYVQDCRACQAKLAVAQQNATDDGAKIAALTHERDAAIIAAKGGTFWRRFRRNALWFVIGAGAGIAVARH